MNKRLCHSIFYLYFFVYYAAGSVFCVNKMVIPLQWPTFKFYFYVYMSYNNMNNGFILYILLFHFLGMMCCLLLFFLLFLCFYVCVSICVKKHASDTFILDKNAAPCHSWWRGNKNWSLCFYFSVSSSSCCCCCRRGYNNSKNRPWRRAPRRFLCNLNFPD